MPVNQEWGPTPHVTSVTKSVNIVGAIPSYTETLRIKDVVGLYPQYSAFRLVILKQYVDTNVPVFIVPFAYTGFNNPGQVPLTSNSQTFVINETGIEITYPIAFQNISLMPPNFYRFRQTFSLQGRNALGFWRPISSITHETRLRLVSDLVLFDPGNFIIDHIIGTTLPSREVTLNGNSWQLLGNHKFTLSSTDPAVFIENQSGPDGPFQNAFGSGTAVVRITLNSFFNIVEPEPYVYSFDTLLINVAGNNVAFVVVRVKKFNTQVLSLLPAQINFAAVKNASEAVPQNLLFESNTAFVLTASSWLTTQVETVLIDGIPTQVIIVAPINSSNQDAGMYVGFVTVVATIEGVLTTKTTVVNYTITDLAQFPYNPAELSFTLDNKFIKIETFNTGTYMQMDTIVQAFDFYTDTMTEYVIQEKIGLFKGRAKVNIGKAIHQILNKTKPVNDNVLQYTPAIVRVNFFENNLADDTNIRSDSSGDLLFLAGLSEGFSDFGFLKFNHRPERVTSKSYKYLTIFTPVGIHNLLVYKNGVLFSETQLPSSEGKVMSVKVEFEAFVQGDKIEYAVKQVTQITIGDATAKSPMSPRISFIVFPEGLHSNHLIWEDEFLVKQSIECTGIFRIPGDLSRLSQKKYVNLVEHLSHLETNKTSKISINTGWLMESDIDTIESLMRSKKVWVQGVGKTIFMVPLNENLVSQDSDRELIDFNLEFQINPNYNEETYRL